MPKKALATIEASDGGIITLSLDDRGRIWHTVAKTGSEFVSSTPQMKTEAEAVIAIRDAWGKPGWKLKFSDGVLNGQR